MARTPAPNGIERSFQDIPDDKITEAEQTAYLMDLGWHKGSSWDELLKSKRILIISEAGAGKTYECRSQQELLWAAGEPAFHVELAELARSNNLRDLLSTDEEVRFDAWLTAQSDIATFFLDSIDELKLSQGSFKQSLNRLAKAVAGQLSRIRVIITSRPIPVDKELFHQILPVPNEPEEAATGEEFADVAMAKRSQISPDEQIARDWRNVALLPLSTAQIKQLAVTQGVDDPEALLADIRKRNAEEFVRRPQDLIELCADWRVQSRIRSHLDQVATNIVVKLKPREDRQEKAALSADKALQGARRLALAATLSRKLTLRHSANADRTGDPTDAPLDPSAILHDWTQEERSTLLERPLFGFASYGRVRFHHRSVIEYLAAKHLLALCEKGMPIRSIKRILFTTAQGEAVVKPSLRPIAAWVALRNEAIFEEMLQREPDVLLNFGDPESLPPLKRQRALRAYVERHGTGGWRGLHVPRVQLHRFAAPELGPEVKRLWEGGIENDEVRELLLNLIGLGHMNDCADIAHGIAIDTAAPARERIHALDALIQLGDPRLAGINASLAEDVSLWPNRLARTALLRLFPSQLSVERLCAVLSRITEPNRSIVGGISWELPHLIARADLSPDALDALRHGLTTLAVEGTVWDEQQWPNLVSQRQFLLPALAVTCLRQIQHDITTPEVMHSTVIALRLAGREYDHTEPAKQLSAVLPDLPLAARRLIFEAEDRLLQAHHPQTEPSKRFARLSSYGAVIHLGLGDAGWLLTSLADRGRSTADRAMLLEAAIPIREDSVQWADHLARLKPHVADLPDLLTLLDQLAEPRKPDPTTQRWQRKDAERRKHEERRNAEAHASWVMFWQEIVNNPDTLFAADRSENTAWNLWQAMEKSGQESRASGWNRRFIERHFGKDVADQLRLAIMAVWRKDRPTLRSERPKETRGVYIARWQLGLAGIYAEAEDPQWAIGLTEEQAKLALRYAPLEWNGFPAWLDGLATVHPAAIDAVLGTELTAELDELTDGHSCMLQAIQYCATSIAQFFVPRLRVWLDAGEWRLGHNEDEAARANRLRQVVQILVQHGDASTVEHIHTLSRAELAEGANDAMSSIWLPILMRLNPADGIDALERTLEPHTPEKFGPATDWFGSLFGDWHRDGETNLLASSFDPELLLRLSRLAYRYIRPADDMVREGGSYSPNARDHAERGRSNIINALLSTSGAEGWAIKLELAEDPLFTDFKDRALAMARERAAEEADSAVSTEADIVVLDSYGELPPLTRDEMFTILTDRLEDIEDALLRDDSPRETWALIKDERTMRREIARELRQNAKGAYTVDQEAVTADEKETDIRLRSTGSAHEAIIELKIGEKKRSAANLKATIREQLVAKYMAAENSRAGCLLITVNSPYKWRHPESGVELDLEGLIAMLNEEAARIEHEMGGSLRLTVRGLDLQPRLLPERAKSVDRQRRTKPE